MIRQRLKLDYVASPHGPPFAGFALLALAIATAGFLAERYRDVKIETAGLETARALLGDERRPARTVPRERLEAEVKSAQAVLRQLALPWNSIIETVEEAASSDVAILQMQPDAQQRQLNLGAEARTQEAMLEYVRKLVAAKSLAEVHVVSHQVQVDDPQRPVQFVVQALLKGDP